MVLRFYLKQNIIKFPKGCFTTIPVEMGKCCTTKLFLCGFRSENNFAKASSCCLFHPISSSYLILSFDIVFKIWNEDVQITWSSMVKYKNVQFVNVFKMKQNTRSTARMCIAFSAPYRYMRVLLFCYWPMFFNGN